MEKESTRRAEEEKNIKKQAQGAQELEQLLITLAPTQRPTDWKVILRSLQELKKISTTATFRIMCQEDVFASKLRIALETQLSNEHINILRTTCELIAGMVPLVPKLVSESAVLMHQLFKLTSDCLEQKVDSASKCVRSLANALPIDLVSSACVEAAQDSRATTRSRVEVAMCLNTLLQRFECRDQDVPGMCHIFPKLLADEKARIHTEIAIKTLGQIWPNHYALLLEMNLGRNLGIHPEKTPYKGVGHMFKPNETEKFRLQVRNTATSKNGPMGPEISPPCASVASLSGKPNDNLYPATSVKKVGLMLTPQGAVSAKAKIEVGKENKYARRHNLRSPMGAAGATLRTSQPRDENAGVNTAPQSAFKTPSRIPTKGSRLFAPLHSSHNKMPS